MIFKCRKCSIEFSIAAPKEIYDNWHGAVATEALTKHRELMPECVDPFLDVVPLSA